MPPHARDFGHGLGGFLLSNYISHLFHFHNEIILIIGGKTMAKKYYAVKEGRKTGVFDSWDECSRFVNGYPGAIYKGFSSKEEANKYIAEGNNDAIDIDNMPYTYVDGSYNSETGVYGCGGFLFYNGQKNVIQANGNLPDMTVMRSVAGELLGSRLAVYKAIQLGLSDICVYYDYTGVKELATGAWKANKFGTKLYYEAMQDYMKKINIHFVKIKSHSGIEGNDEADRLAKEAAGIRIKCKIPKESIMTESIVTSNENVDLIVIAGKTGSGKTTLSSVLSKAGYNRIITYTTRQMRPGEINGKDYHFIPDELFDYLKKDFLLEWTSYKKDGKTYQFGSSKTSYLAPGKHVAVLDKVGLIALKKAGIPYRGFFIDVPDDELRQRLLRRGTESIDQINERLEKEEKTFLDIEKYAMLLPPLLPEELKKIICQ